MLYLGSTGCKALPDGRSGTGLQGILAPSSEFDIVIVPLDVPGLSFQAVYLPQLLLLRVCASPLRDDDGIVNLSIASWRQVWSILVRWT